MVTLPSIVLYCPHLGRDLREIQDALPDVFILHGQPTPQGHDGCLEMHKEAVRLAIMNEWPEVFVVEDDCAFTHAFNYERWCLDAMWARDHRYDVLVGGSTRTYDERLVRDGLIEVSAFHSAHCVVYLESGYEKALHAIQPYDLSLGRDCGMRCVVVWPFVAVQRPSFSGILQQSVDYVPLYWQHERELAQQLGLRR